MVDYKDTVEGQRSWLEWITGKIPFYGGYKEKENRREADRLLRDHLVNEFREALTNAEDITNQMLTGPGLLHLDQIGRGNTRLQTLIDKIKTAEQGYSGFFSPIKMDEDALDALYEFDYNMLVKLDEIKETLSNIQTALDTGDESQMGAAVRRYIKTVTEASTLFDKRKDKILQLV